jgi:hypothetical protein
MSAKNDAATKTVNAEEKVSVPAQPSAEESARVVIVATGDLATDINSTLTDKDSKGMKVTIVRGENGNLEVVPVEGNQLVNKAKGLFQRNKKLVVATGALLATSVLLRVIARRAELEADEVVEFSDEISTEA